MLTRKIVKIADDYDIKKHCLVENHSPEFNDFYFLMTS